MEEHFEPSTINERISEVLSYLKISQTAFAKSLGTSATRISNIVKCRNKPDSQLLSDIIEGYPQINSRWLLTGRGSMVENVNFSGKNKPEVFTKKCVKNTPPDTPPDTPLSTPPSQSSTTKAKKSAKDASVLSEGKWQNNLLNLGGALPETDYESLKDRYDQARSDLEQREWRNIDRRLKSVSYNILLVQELAEELVGTPFDRDFYPALQEQITPPSLKRIGNNQYVNPLNEMDYDTKSKYYAERATILEHSEDMFDDLLHNLHMALFSPTPKRVSPNSRQGTIAELLYDFLKTRFEKHWREEWKA